MQIEKLLTIKGIFKGNNTPEYQYYQVLLEDQDGKKYLSSVGCRMIHADGTEKAFSRMLLIQAPVLPQGEEITADQTVDGVLADKVNGVEPLDKPEETKESTDGSSQIIIAKS